jgi:hypothetical protein
MGSWKVHHPVNALRFVVVLLWSAQLSGSPACLCAWPTSPKGVELLLGKRNGHDLQLKNCPVIGAFSPLKVNEQLKLLFLF